MRTIRFKRNWRRFKAGDTHSLALGVADLLCRRNIAEFIDPAIEVSNVETTTQATLIETTSMSDAKPKPRAKKRGRYKANVSNATHTARSSHLS